MYLPLYFLTSYIKNTWPSFSFITTQFILSACFLLQLHSRMACKVSPIKDKEGNNSHSFFLPFLQKMLPRATRIKLKQKNKNDAFQHFDHHHLLVFINAWLNCGKPQSMKWVDEAEAEDRSAARSSSSSKNDLKEFHASLAICNQIYFWHSISRQALNALN